MSPVSRPTPGIRPANMSTSPTTAISSPKTTSSLPMSDMSTASLEEPALAGRCRRRLLAQMQVGLPGHPASGGRADHEGDLQQIRLHQLDERFGLVVDGG